jgi:GntR family transcriptional regulator of arabinose operon
MAKSFKYKLLMQHLMVSINAGEFSVGSRLPTEKEFATQYQVSIQTVRQAMLQLKQNGIIRQVSGSGTFLLRRPGMQTMENAETKAQVHNIGVVVWNTSIHVFPRIIHSIEQEVFQSGMHLVTCSSDDQPDQERLIFERLVQQGISGLIVSPILWHERRVENYAFLVEQGIPFVFINRNVPRFGVSSVTVDNELGAFRAMQHLIGLGHTRIGHLTAGTATELTEDRIRGYRRALQKAGLPVDEDLIAPNLGPGKQVGYAGAMRLLQSAPRPTAIFCVNDEHAVGLMEAARALGLRVPHDLSVVSFDNSHVARSHFPIGLDSIDYPAEEMGLSAVQELLACMGQDRWVAKGIMLEPELIIRQSSAPPAGAKRKATITA